jgi:hypothetical protein
MGRRSCGFPVSWAAGSLRVAALAQAVARIERSENRGSFPRVSLCSTRATGAASCHVRVTSWSNTAHYRDLMFIDCLARRTSTSAVLPLRCWRQVIPGLEETAMCSWKSCASFGTQIQATLSTGSSAGAISRDPPSVGRVSGQIGACRFRPRNPPARLPALSELACNPISPARTSRRKEWAADQR